mgnify:CR=1 FL=1
MLFLRTVCNVHSLVWEYFQDADVAWARRSDLLTATCYPHCTLCAALATGTTRAVFVSASVILCIKGAILRTSYTHYCCSSLLPASRTHEVHVLANRPYQRWDHGLLCTYHMLVQLPLGLWQFQLCLPAAAKSEQHCVLVPVVHMVVTVK